MTSPFAMLAAYNAWCNRRIYQAAGKLSDAEYRADRGAFFKSVHGTLNPLLAADRIWMKRFTGQGEAPTRLDAILCETLVALRQEREKEDARILAYMNGLSESDIGGRFRYRTLTTSEDVEQPLAPALFHFFNHQTHHRGQVHCLLTGFGHEAPVLDLLAFQRESGMGMT